MKYANLIIEALNQKRDRDIFEHLLRTGPLTWRLDQAAAKLAKSWAVGRNGP